MLPLYWDHPLDRYSVDKPLSGGLNSGTNNEKQVEKKEYRTGRVVSSAGHASVPHAAHDEQLRKSSI